MRKLVYDAQALFADIERRLNNGERIVCVDCNFPDCSPSKGKIFFYKQGEGIVVGLCDCNNQKNIVYNGKNRDLKWLAEHKAIYFDNIVQIFNLFFRMDAIYSTTDKILTYYVDGYGYYKDGKYVFSLEKKGSSWRAYIQQMPSYGNRDQSLMVTHRLRDGNRLYVCVQGDISDKEKMIQVAQYWARCEQKYIETGERFG